MEHQPEAKESKHETNDPAKPKRVKLVGNLEWSFWANSAGAVLGLLAAGLLVTPVFDFMSQTAKIYCIAAGICVGFSTAVLFFAHSIVLHREGRSTIQLEAKEQAEKAALKEKLDRLDDRLEKTEKAVAIQSPRILSESDKNAIAKAVSKFGGQWFSVFAINADPEALGYGYCFTDALTRAGWDSRNCGVGQQVFSVNFENVRIAINRDDIQNGKIPDAALALLNILNRLKTTSMVVFNDMGTGVQKGEIRIYIGLRHIKDVPATKPQ